MCRGQIAARPLIVIGAVGALGKLNGVPARGKLREADSAIVGDVDRCRDLDADLDLEVTVGHESEEPTAAGGAWWLLSQPKGRETRRLRTLGACACARYRNPSQVEM